MDLAAADTIAATATAEGPGCRAIVRLCGTLCPEIAAQLAGQTFDWSRSFAERGFVELPAWGRNVPARFLGWPAGRSSSGQPMLE